MTSLCTFRRQAMVTSLGLQALVLSLVLGGGSAWAQKPEWAGQGKGPGKAERSQAAGPDRTDIRVSVYFGDVHRQVLRDYYSPRIRAGNCPPGLAKKNNGCMPPGLAKAWRLGQPLPRDVMYYPLPNEVAVRLGTPPAGHKFVRVAADILLIAVGTSMVIDAIEDLSSL